MPRHLAFFTLRLLPFLNRHPFAPRTDFTVGLNGNTHLNVELIHQIRPTHDFQHPVVDFLNHVVADTEQNSVMHSTTYLHDITSVFLPELDRSHKVHLISERLHRRVDRLTLSLTTLRRVLS